MDGRRVILLTKGYLHGWLDFTYKNHLSKVRENYIVNWIENQDILNIAKLRTSVDCTVASGIKSPEVIKLAFESYDRYRQLALPYIAKKGNMDLEGLSKTDMIKQLKEQHAHNKAVFAKLKEQRAQNHESV